MKTQQNHHMVLNFKYVIRHCMSLRRNRMALWSFLTPEREWFISGFKWSPLKHPNLRTTVLLLLLIGLHWKIALWFLEFSHWSLHMNPATNLWGRRQVGGQWHWLKSQIPDQLITPKPPPSPLAKSTCNLLVCPRPGQLCDFRFPQENCDDHGLRHISIDYNKNVGDPNDLLTLLSHFSPLHNLFAAIGGNQSKSNLELSKSSFLSILKPKLQSVVWRAHKIQGQTTDWEKTFALYLTNKESIIQTI